MDLKEQQNVGLVDLEERHISGTAEIQVRQSHMIKGYVIKKCFHVRRMIVNLSM